jgi:hypothetical protein
MEKSNLQLVIDNLNKKGIKFTLHSEWVKKQMQDPEFRKLWEANHPEPEAKKESSNQKSQNILGTP